MNAPPFANFQPGQVLAGKYRIERVIGQGGMGIVASVQHVQLEQRMALKLMLPQAMLNGDAVSRFVREARAAARISSEHVARVFDVGTLDTGEPYIAMEYLEGSDIAQLLTTQGRLAPAQAVEYLLQACEALAEAHAAGIVHRDLKPGNLFLVQRVDGQRLVKVLDFGISKMTGASAQSNAPATLTSALMGSPLYMSPEQMGSSKAVDARSDVWALGVVLYEMLSGSPPFNGETLPQVCGMVLNEAPPPLAESAPGLAPLLYQAVARCLEKEPAARFQSVAELANALEPIASPRARQSVERIARVQGVARSEGAAALPLTTTDLHAQAAMGLPQGTYAPWGETKPPVAARPSRARMAIIGLAALSLTGTGLWIARPVAKLPAPSAAAPASAKPQPRAELPQAAAAATPSPIESEPAAPPVVRDSLPSTATSGPATTVKPPVARPKTNATRPPHSAAAANSSRPEANGSAASAPNVKLAVPPASPATTAATPKAATPPVSTRSRL
jgi:serine/threonine-protein kinase